MNEVLTITKPAKTALRRAFKAAFGKDVKVQIVKDNRKGRGECLRANGRVGVFHKLPQWEAFRALAAELLDLGVDVRGILHAIGYAEENGGCQIQLNIEPTVIIAA